MVIWRRPRIVGQGCPEGTPPSAPGFFIGGPASLEPALDQSQKASSTKASIDAVFIRSRVLETMIGAESASARGSASE